MNKTYDSKSAERLIPLLRVLNREISERTVAIRVAARRIYGLRRDRSRIDARARRDEEALLRAQIANHRREIRCTERELARLGCLVDADDPTTFHIPGTSGGLRDGFVWHVGETRIKAVTGE